MKDEIMQKYKSFEELKKELGNNYDKIMYDMNLELVKQKEKAIEHIKKHQLIYRSQYEEESNFDNHLIEILQGSDKE